MLSAAAIWVYLFISPTINCKIVEHQVVIDKLAGIRQTYTVEDVKERIIASLDQLLMSWIAKEGE